MYAMQNDRRHDGANLAQRVILKERKFVRHHPYRIEGRRHIARGRAINDIAVRHGGINDPVQAMRFIQHMNGFLQVLIAGSEQGQQRPIGIIAQSDLLNKRNGFRRNLGIILKDQSLFQAPLANKAIDIDMAKRTPYFTRTGGVIDGTCMLHDFLAAERVTIYGFGKFIIQIVTPALIFNTLTAPKGFFQIDDENFHAFSLRSIKKMRVSNYAIPINKICEYIIVLYINFENIELHSPVSLGLGATSVVNNSSKTSALARNSRTLYHAAFVALYYLLNLF